VNLQSERVKRSVKIEGGQESGHLWIKSTDDLRRHLCWQRQNRAGYGIIEVTMEDLSEEKRLNVGADSREIAVRARPGTTPGVFWLGGFKSDMQGSKAEALDGWAAHNGRQATRFDYSGHGRSGGAFEDGTISRWLEEALAVFRHFTDGPQIIVGSSMGGWIALLVVKALRESKEMERLAGLVLIAPAIDMTETLLWDRFDDAARREIEEKGFYEQPSDYSDEPYIFTRDLIGDGKAHCFGEAIIETGCPVHVIQGMLDTDVPWTHATALMERLALDDAVLTLVRDGDHRLSRGADIGRLIRAVEEIGQR
jgi:pimeloyl-ACP methyl ester carboxylesterase